MMLQGIIIALVVSLISGLAAFTFTMIWSKSCFKEKAQQFITVHEQIHHQDSIYKHVKEKLQEHRKECRANNGFERIEKGVYFLLIKNGASQEDLQNMGF